MNLCLLRDLRVSAVNHLDNPLPDLDRASSRSDQFDMPGLLARLRQWAVPRGPDRGRDAGQARRVARRLAAAIEKAGDAAAAGRYAERGARFAAKSARLTECLARLHLSGGDPETALRTIDGCRSRPASLRLLRAACLLLLGQRAEAHLDLLHWSARATAPLDARVLLALLEWQRGHHDDAIRSLQRNLRHLDDPRTLAALVLVCAHRGRSGQVAFWASRLREAARVGGTHGAPDVEILLQSLGLPGRAGEASPVRQEIDSLAMELLTAEPAIPALVEAQRLRPDPATIALLRQALERTHGDLADQSAGAEALSRLALLEGDRDATARWARRGLDLNPMSASLTRLANELDAADARVEAA